MAEADVQGILAFDPPSELERAERHWNELARAEESGVAGPGATHRATLYRRTAQSLRLEIVTGQPHCTCCLSPDAWHWAKS